MLKENHNHFILSIFCQKSIPSTVTDISNFIAEHFPHISEGDAKSRELLIADTIGQSLLFYSGNNNSGEVASLDGKISFFKSIIDCYTDLPQPLYYVDDSLFAPILSKYELWNQIYAFFYIDDIKFEDLYCLDIHSSNPILYTEKLSEIISDAKQSHGLIIPEFLFHDYEKYNNLKST